MDFRKIQISTNQVSLLQLLNWANSFPFACFLDGNGYNQYPHGPFPSILAVGNSEAGVKSDSIFEALNAKSTDWWFGYMGYDLKNEIVGMDSKPPDRWNFPSSSFFKAEVLVEWSEDFTTLSAANPESVWEQIKAQSIRDFPIRKAVEIREFQSRENYCQVVEQIQEGIRQGNVYEVNYCRFFECNEALDGLEAFLGLREISPSPFSGWYKTPELEIASASPERFLKKSGCHLVSQPIKGTAPRRHDPVADEAEIQALLHSEKERAENLMIVDLVRNDLARVSVPGSTQVSELFGIYSFPQVHQMTSTIESDIRPGTELSAVLHSTFPMGSMTGAPKLEVMNWIDRLETQQRGAFSGALGFINPENDFDFNVLIRSLFINHRLKITGFAVGSAITIDSVPEQEWDECENKAAAIRSWLKGG